MTNRESRAYYFAKAAHGFQLDDDGRNYFQAHVLHVVSILKAAGCEEDIIIAGYLHDTIEDCGITYKGLRELFGERVADLVNEVTHEGKKDQHGYYFPRLHSRDGIVLKLADRMSNLLRFDSWDKKRQQHYLKKTKFWKATKNDTKEPQ